MQVLHERCAGLDVHKKTVVADRDLIKKSGHLRAISGFVGKMPWAENIFLPEVPPRARGLTARGFATSAVTGKGSNFSPGH
jgi:hypothetical protein